MVKISDLEKQLGPTKTQLETGARVEKTLSEMTSGLVSQQVLKSISETTRKLGLLGTSPAIAEAVKSANAARSVVGRDLGRTLAPPPEIRWRAETKAASVATRDAVFALADAVDALVESSERSSRRLIALTFALAVMTAAVVVLTALLVI